MKEYNLAILGATGAVGQEFINLLNERDFPFKNLKLLASARSAGKELTVRGKTYKVEEAKADSFNGVDVALFAGGSISKTFAPIAVKAGAVVIDNSSTYRMDPEVPLIVPEVNPQDIKKHKGIIANPNCSTIIMVMALKPIYDLARIKRIIVSTYQAASGAGKDGLDSKTSDREQIVYEISDAGPERIFYVGDAFRIGMTLKEVQEATNIDPWFLIQIQEIIDIEKRLEGRTLSSLTREELLFLKQKGFSVLRSFSTCLRTKCVLTAG
jgi:aspartate-semialdehyde dehydrogenase